MVPLVLVSVALPATLYQPLPISVTAPAGAANAPLFFLIVTVGDRPVLPVMWSTTSIIRKGSGDVADPFWSSVASIRSPTAAGASRLRARASGGGACGRRGSGSPSAHSGRT